MLLGTGTNVGPTMIKPNASGLGELGIFPEPNLLAGHRNGGPVNQGSGPVNQGMIQEYLPQPSPLEQEIARLQNLIQSTIESRQRASSSQATLQYPGSTTSTTVVRNPDLGWHGPQ